MTYVYDAGVSTPGYAGLIEIPTVIRLNSSPLTPTEPAGGTFKLADNPLAGGPPVRLPVATLPSDSGGILGPQFYDPWHFTIPGWLWVPSGPDDVPAAQEQLKAAFAPSKGLLTLQVNMRGWAAPRQIQAQTNGPFTFAPRHGRLVVPTRDFTIPMVAPTPMLTAATPTTQAIAVGGSGTLTNTTNNGTASANFTVRFTGPITNPQLVQNVAPSYPQIALLGTTITAGHWIEIDTQAGTAIDNTGADRYADITAFSVTTVPPGTAGWFVNGTGTSGATAVSVTFRDSWG